MELLKVGHQVSVWSCNIVEHPGNIKNLSMDCDKVPNTFMGILNESTAIIRKLSITDSYRKLCFINGIQCSVLHNRLNPLACKASG